MKQPRSTISVITSRPFSNSVRFMSPDTVLFTAVYYGLRSNVFQIMVGEKVRREKALDFSGCNSRPGTGSLHPVAIETAAEATKPLELSV